MISFSLDSLAEKGGKFKGMGVNMCKDTKSVVNLESFKFLKVSTKGRGINLYFCCV